MLQVPPPAHPLSTSAQKKRARCSQEPAYRPECIAQRERRGNLFLRDLCQPNSHHSQTFKSQYPMPSLLLFTALR